MGAKLTVAVLTALVVAILTVVVLGSIAPKEGETPMSVSTIPKDTAANVCAGFGYPSSLALVSTFPSFSIYEVGCSDGIKVTASW